MGKRPRLLFSLYDGYIENEEGRFPSYILQFDNETQDELYFTRDAAGLEMMARLLSEEYHPKGAGRRMIGQKAPEIDTILTSVRRGGINHRGSK